MASRLWVSWKGLREEKKLPACRAPVFGTSGPQATTTAVWYAAVCEENGREIAELLGSHKHAFLDCTFTTSRSARTLELACVVDLPHDKALFVLRTTTRRALPATTSAYLPPRARVQIGKLLYGPGIYQLIDGWWIFKAGRPAGASYQIGAPVFYEQKAAGLVVGISDRNCYCLNWCQLIARLHHACGRIFLGAPGGTPAPPENAAIDWSELRQRAWWLAGLSLPEQQHWGVLAQCLPAGLSVPCTAAGGGPAEFKSWTVAGGSRWAQDADTALRWEGLYRTPPPQRTSESWALHLAQPPEIKDFPGGIRLRYFFFLPYNEPLTMCCQDPYRERGVHHDKCPRPRAHEYVFTCEHKKLRLRQGINCGRLMYITCGQKRVTLEEALAQLARHRAIRLHVVGLQRVGGGSVQTIRVKCPRRTPPCAGAVLPA